MLTFNYPLNAVYIFICVMKLIEASNIDSTYPIIIKNTADGPDSHFGATVSLVKDGIKSPGIIIGAPKANSTLISHSGISEPGVVWQCFFDRKTQVCRIIDMDPTGNVPDPNRGNVTDRKDEGWLGGSVAQDSENFVTCANRWVNEYYEKKTAQYNMNGICYWRSKDDLFQNDLPEPVEDSRLLPLINKDRQTKQDWEQGQAGFSVHIPSKGNEIIIGAPGIDAWRGSVIKYTNENSGNPFRDFLVVNPETSTEKDSYFGFVVSSGNFLKIDSKTQVQYVTGAPRGNKLNGEVVIFRFPETANDKWEKLWVINGKQIGSYFGSSICVADINGDGLDDLLVGAPKHRLDSKISDRKASFEGLSEKKSLHRGYGDEGAVHVYLSTGMALVSQQIGLISGRNRPWAQFGTAITNLGDINGDGKDDIAIGAPYENEGSGAVYIFNGGDTGIKKQSQIILGKTFDLNIRAFGYSFSEGVDIDNNGLNDLAIGAYDTNQVVVLRTRPMIMVYAKVSSNTERLSFDPNFESFEVQSCVSYIGDNAPDTVDIRVRIMIDVQSRPPRFLLQFPLQADRAAEHTYLEKMYKGTESCTKFIAHRVRLLESSGNPVVIQQEISLTEKSQPISRTTFEIIQFGGQMNTRVSGAGVEAFCKDCPVLDTTMSKIEELKLPLDVPCGDDSKCVADLRLDVGFKELTPDGTFVIGSSSVLTMKLKMTNVAETAISPAVIISWKQRNLRKIPSECQEHHKNDTFWSYKCTYGQLLEEGRFKQTVLEFRMGDLVAGSLDELWLEIEGITASELLQPSKQTVVIPLISQADIEIKGTSIKRSFNPSTLIAQTSFKNDFEVTLEGPTPISGAIIDFQIPVSFSTPSLSKTTIRVYEPQPTITQNVIRCYALSGSFASGQTVSIQDIAARRRRIEEATTITSKDEESSTEDIVDEFLDADDKLSEAGLNNLFNKAFKGSNLKISCDLPTVECMKVICTTNTFTPGTRAFVTIPMSITSISLRSLFSRNKLASLELVSQGKVSIIGTDKDIQTISNKPDEADAITLIELEAYKKVPTWIYGVSIIAGFLILACVIFCLYASGCFDRKKKPTEDEVDNSTHESIPLQDSVKFGSDDMDNDYNEEKEDEVFERA